MPRNALDNILGTTTKIRLLRALLPLQAPASGREAERLAAVPHYSAGRALRDLVALGVLRRTTTPGTHLYEINREHDLVPALAALFEGESARLASLPQTSSRETTAPLSSVDAPSTAAAATGSSRIWRQSTLPQPAARRSPGRSPATTLPRSRRPGMS